MRSMVEGCALQSCSDQKAPPTKCRPTFAHLPHSLKQIGEDDLFQPQLFQIHCRGRVTGGRQPAIELCANCADFGFRCTLFLQVYAEEIASSKTEAFALARDHFACCSDFLIGQSCQP